MTTPQIFHCLHYDDADRAINFLLTLGFTEVLTVRNSTDASVIDHAELRWRDHGGVMLGTRRHGGRTDSQSAVPAVCYVVVPTDADVDATYARATGADGSSVEPPADRSFGGRMATIADPEGNLWSFGSYPGV